LSLEGDGTAAGDGAPWWPFPESPDCVVRLRRRDFRHCFVALESATAGGGNPLSHYTHVEVYGGIGAGGWRPFFRAAA
jgi:hypothetical protein